MSQHIACTTHVAPHSLHHIDISKQHTLPRRYVMFLRGILTASRIPTSQSSNEAQPSWGDQRNIRAKRGAAKVTVQRACAGQGRGMALVFVCSGVGWAGQSSTKQRGKGDRGTGRIAEAGCVQRNPVPRSTGVLPWPEVAGRKSG